MRIPALRQMLLVVLAGLAGPGCAKEELMMHKADVHEAFPDERIAELADAVADGDRDRVRRLASTTALDAKGDDDVTLLQWAVLNSSLSGLEALLEAGADPSLQGMDGYTVMHTAALVKDPKFLELLLDRRISPDIRNREGQTPLFAAITGKRDAQFDALIAAGADVNATDSVEDTPLHIAASTNDASRVLTLLHAGANPSAVNRQRATFQDYLFQIDTRMLNEKSKQDREAIRAWLLTHKVPFNNNGS